MYWIIIPIIYILGFILSLWAATWYEYHNCIKWIKHLRPDYRKAWHNPYALFISIFSWIGVIVMLGMSYHKFNRMGFKVSYKSLWKEWDKNHINDHEIKG
jgi:hypothetical protein